ncbi:MAG: hypothetical protein KGO96_06810 [Elusimicrobia bacterium]|nr:hypothetical protein [Elusimicrobiota bacterium]
MNKTVVNILNILNWIGLAFMLAADAMVIKGAGMDAFIFIMCNALIGWFLCEKWATNHLKLAESIRSEAALMQKNAHSIVNDCSIITNNIQSEIVRLLKEGHIIVDPDKKGEFTKLQSDLDSMNNMLKIAVEK